MPLCPFFDPYHVAFFDVDDAGGSDVFFAFNIHDGGRVVASSEILGLVKDKLGDLDLSLRMIPAL